MTERVLTDRRIHAAYPGMQIVRYDRGGKWYLEPVDKTLRRQRVSIDEAAKSAVWGLANGGVVLFGLPGGKQFDARVRGSASSER